MIKKLTTWLAQNESKFTDSGFHVERIFEQNQGDNNSYSIIHCSKYRMGEIIIWKERFVDIEIGNIKTGDREFYLHCEHDNKIDIVYLFELYLSLMIKS